MIKICDIFILFCSERFLLIVPRVLGIVVVVFMIFVVFVVQHGRSSSFPHQRRHSATERRSQMSVAAVLTLLLLFRNFFFFCLCLIGFLLPLLSMCDFD